MPFGGSLGTQPQGTLQEIGARAKQQTGGVGKGFTTTGRPAPTRQGVLGQTPQAPGGFPPSPGDAGLYFSASLVIQILAIIRVQMLTALGQYKGRDRDSSVARKI